MTPPQDVDFIKAACGGADYLLLRTALKRDQVKGFYFQELASGMCHRSTGVGAKGIIDIDRSAMDKDNPLVMLTVASPQYSPDFLSYDALLCTGRYLFDTGLFGLKPIPLQCWGESFVLESVDSQNFRLQMATPTNEGRPIDLRSPLHRMSGDETNPLPLEIHQKIAAVYRPGLDGQGLKKAALGHRDKLFGRPHIYYNVPQRDLVVAAVRHSSVADYSSVAALTALAAHLEGFCADEILLTLNDYPFFIQINFPGPTLWITAPIRFAFSGTYSPDPSPSILF